jgi:predicted ABC-type ATPase
MRNEVLKERHRVHFNNIKTKLRTKMKLDLAFYLAFVVVLVLNLIYRLWKQEQIIYVHCLTNCSFDRMSEVSTKHLHSLRAEQSLRRFSIKRSTEECFESLENGKSIGAHGHVREKLDYSYHTRYEKTRQWLHDSIIEEILHNYESARHGQHPLLLFTVGAQGAGKRQVIGDLVKDKRLPLPSYVIVDSDEIRRYLPEYSSYIEENSADLVDFFTQKECGFIAETIIHASLQAGNAVIFDCSLKDAAWYVKFIQQLRDEYSCIKVGMIHVKTKTDTILERSRLRALETGRTIPEETILASLEWIPRAIEVVKPSVDHFFEIRNNDNAQTEIEGADWAEFTEAFFESGCLEKGEPVEEVAFPKPRPRMRRFSSVRSSEDNYKTDDTNFYGQYAHIVSAHSYSFATLSIAMF